MKLYLKQTSDRTNDHWNNFENNLSNSLANPRPVHNSWEPVHGSKCPGLCWSPIHADNHTQFNRAYNIRGSACEFWTPVFWPLDHTMQLLRQRICVQRLFSTVYRYVQYVSYIFIIWLYPLQVDKTDPRERAGGDML